MKKILLSLITVLMAVGAWAQTITKYSVTATQYTSGNLNSKTEETYIAIKNLSSTNNYYYVGNTGAAPYSKADFSNDAVFIWEPAGDNQFYLKKLDGTYMQKTSPKDFGTVAAAAKFTTTNPTSAGSGSTKFNGDNDSKDYISGNDDPNLVRFVTTEGKWINVQNGDNGTPLYNTGEGGWTIHYVYQLESEEVDKYQFELTELLVKAQALYDEAKDKKDVIGYYTAVSVDALGEAITTAEGVVDATVSDVNALQGAIDDLKVVYPTVGRFYRFKHPTDDAYMLSDVSSEKANRLAMGALENNKVSSIFYYGEDGSLLSYAIGQYVPAAVQNGNWTCLAVGSEAPVVTFGAGSALGRVGFYIGSDDTRAYYSGRKTYVDAGGSIAQDSSYDWVVEEVTWLPVAMNTEGGYATVYSPVQLGLNDRVKAYTGVVEGEVLKLSEQTAVPANVGVVLEYITGAEIENGYVFLPVQDNPVSVAENDLEGTFASTYVEKESYVLSSVEGVTGFYKADLNQTDNTAFKNNGFKAYLPASAVTAGARFLSFDFGTETAIENIEGAEDAENTVVYDLSGRRVQKVQKGLYIVNGKVVIK